MFYNSGCRGGHEVEVELEPAAGNREPLPPEAGDEFARDVELRVR